MLIGAHSVKVEANGRLTVPEPVRAELGDELVFAYEPENGKCLRIYSAEGWRKRLEFIFGGQGMRLSYQDELLRDASDLAHSVKLDPLGRCVLPEDLRSAIGLRRDGRVIGLMEFAELWAAEERAYQRRRREEPEVAAARRSLWDELIVEARRRHGLADPLVPPEPEPAVPADGPGGAT